MDCRNGYKVEHLDPCLCTSYVALGALAENIITLAELDGFAVNVSCEGEGFLLKQDHHQGFLLRFTRRLPVAGDEDRSSTLELIKRRRTNRGPYLNKRLTQTSEELLRSHLDRLGHGRLITDATQINFLGVHLTMADSFRYKDHVLLKEFLTMLRLGPNSRACTDGIDEDALGVSLGTRLSLRILKSAPRGILKLYARYLGDRIYRVTAVGRLIQQSAAILFLSQPEDTPQAWFGLGRAMQAAWLDATRLGLVAQPLGATVVLYHAMNRSRFTEAFSGLSDCDFRTLEGIREEIRSKLDIDLGKPCIALRIGEAIQSSAVRSYRHGIDSVAARSEFGFKYGNGGEPTTFRSLHPPSESVHLFFDYSAVFSLKKPVVADSWAQT